MEKRLTRSDYVFAITFIFMLVLALGTFFFGLRLGQERSAAKYEELIAKLNESSQGYTAYDQQYLVSFYHTIYQPYREFHIAWFEKTAELESNRSSDPSLIIKDLAKLSEESYDQLSAKVMPDSSPLLQTAHKNYMKSLKLFNEAMLSYQAKANAVPGSELVAQLNADAYLGEAKNFALKAEKDYYEAIVKWFETVNPEFKPIDVTKPVTAAEWSKLSLNMKNDYSANILLSGRSFSLFTPQDLTSRIDEMILSGQAKKMNLQDVQQIVNLLLATDAMRDGDFNRNKNKWYGNETLPQLPFFTN